MSDKKRIWTEAAAKGTENPVHISSEVFSQKELLKPILELLDGRCYGHLLAMSCLCFAKCIQCMYPTGVTTSLLWVLQSLRMCQWILERIECSACAVWKKYMGPILCKVSASLGSLDVLEWLLKHSFEMDSDTCRAAIKAGELELLEFALAKGCKMDEELKEYACELAALIGNQAMLKFVRTYGAGWGVEVSAAAAFNGDLPMLEYLWRHHCLFDESSISKAASQGYLSVVEWLLKRGCPYNNQVCSEAAGGGHTGLLEWALRKNLPWDAFTCGNRAAEGGHLKTLQCVIAKEAEWNEETMSLAAASGNLAMVEWMVKNGCPVSPMANTYAAFKGHLTIMEWLRTKDYQCDVNQSYIFAAGGGHVDVLEWLLVNKCPGTTPLSMAFNAIKNGHLHVLEWMGKNTGIVKKFNTHGQKDLCAQAAEHGHLEVLKWLRLNDAAWEEEKCMGHAAYNGHLGVVRWIYKGRSEGMKFTEKEALDGGHISVLWWAFEKGLIESKRS